MGVGPFHHFAGQSTIGFGYRVVLIDDHVTYYLNAQVYKQEGLTDFSVGLDDARTAVSSVSSDQQIANGAYDLETRVVADSQWSRKRQFSILFGFFSRMALLLALVGLFSVVS